MQWDYMAMPGLRRMERLWQPVKALIEPTRDIDPIHPASAKRLKIIGE
jgi:hypothetical protein